ncbi:EAL domain-containing protein [Type-D symbiont of Plautia stali]|uniref:EAL domain-containing protein n=1 Tax=Type-D symbiont of Plautia stali TaxID=1560356 RepID=UPI00073EA165
MRCGNKKGNEASPTLFIPLAEQSGMIGELTLQLLEKVREDFAMLSAKGLYLSVNITSEIVETPEPFVNY